MWWPEDDMTVAEDLRVLIDNYTEYVSNLDVMVTNLGTEIASLNAEISTIEVGVKDGASNALLSKLEARRVAEGWQIVKTTGDYGVEDIKEWLIYKYDGNVHSSNLNRLGDDSFKIYPGAPVVRNAIVRINGTIERTVTNVVTIPYQPGPDPPAYPGQTTVTLLAGETAIPASLNSYEGCEVAYRYYPSEVNWDADPDIIADMNAFEIGFDQITAEINLEGTYGLDARVANITTGRAVQINNRNKYQEFITLYEPYAAS
jgi:hypothetical protein